MRREPFSSGCSVVIGSMTQTMKAQKILAAAAIRTEVVKADSAGTRHGCAYALDYPCSQDIVVRRVLRDAGIRVRGGGLR